MIHVSWLAPGNQWDSNIVRRLLDGKLYPHGIEVKHHTGYAKAAGTILVVPGRYWHKAMPDIEDAVASYEWLLLFRTSDEEDLFDVNEFAGPERTKFWVQTPRREYPGARLFGVGFPAHFNHLSLELPEKKLNVFISAQDTHQRRHECFDSLDGLPDSKPGRVHRTPGFTQGMDPAEYVRCMSKAKVAPCPSGAVSVDSFRFWEALEAHSLPVPDAVSPVDGETNYWDRIGYPFPVVGDWSAVPWSELLNDCPANLTTAWWMRYKRQLALNLVEDLEMLGAI